MVKIKTGDRITLPTVRPSNWNKNGEMDKFLGKTVTVTTVYDRTNTLQQFHFVTDDGIKSDLWQFLSTDLQSRFQIGKFVGIKRPFKIFRNFGKNYDICDDDGNCLTVNESEIFLLQLNNGNTMKAMKDAVYTTAKQLLKANNTVTTLEVKNELRRDYPYYYWTQDVVSKYMAQLAGDGVLNYKDNGTYRIYSLANTTPTKSISTSPIVKVQSRRTKTPKPSKNAVIFRSSVANFVDGASNSFEAVTLSSGKTVDRNTIRNQKKSLLGYILPKLHNVVSITAAGKTYLVK